MYHTKIIKSHLKVQLSDGLITVRPARTYSNGCKSLNHPDSGNVAARGTCVLHETESEESPGRHLVWRTEIRYEAYEWG